MSGDIQVTYAHVSVLNNPLGEMVTAFVLSGYLEVTTMVLIGVERAFMGDGKKIRLPTTEVLLCAAVGDLAKYKNLQDLTSVNPFLLRPFLTEAVVTNREAAAEVLLKPFVEKINYHEE